MTEPELSNLIRRVFLKGDPNFPLQRTTNLLEEGICDSLGLVQLAAEIESATGVAIQDQDITRDGFGSIDAILQLLDQSRG